MRSILGSVTVAIGLIACGGGGGGGGGGVESTAQALTLQGAPLITITPENHATVASSALSSGFGMLATTSAGGSTPTVGRSNAAVYATGVATTQSSPCPNGGSSSFTQNDNNGNNKPDAGDSGSLINTNCTNGGTSLDGETTFTINSVTGDTNSPPFSTSMLMNLNHLKVTTGNTYSVTDAAITLTMSVDNSGNTAMMLSGASASIKTFNGSQTDFVLMTNHSLGLSITSYPRSYSILINGTIASTAMGSKAITIATVTPFMANGSDLYPSSGQVTITGAAGGKARVTALNNTQVQLELDANGDGSYELSSVRPWSEFK